MKKLMKNKCSDCYKRKTPRLNLFKKENAPLFYVVECGLCPSPDYESDCPYFEKKEYPKRIIKFIKKKLDKENKIC